MCLCGHGVGKKFCMCSVVLRHFVSMTVSGKILGRDADVSGLFLISVNQS